MRFVSEPSPCVSSPSRHRAFRLGANARLGLSRLMLAKAPVTPGLRPGYDLPATEKCWNRWQIVDRTYDWSQRLWVIARAKSVAARSMVMFKTSNLRFQIVGGRGYVFCGRTTGRAWWHHQLWMIADRQSHDS